jgi:hypothetical protein
MIGTTCFHDERDEEGEMFLDGGLVNEAVRGWPACLGLGCDAHSATLCVAMNYYFLF